MARPKSHTEAVIHFGKQTRVKYVYGELLMQTDADDYITGALNGLIARASDLRIPFQQFQPTWFAAIRDVFNAGGIAVPWPELSQAYADRVHGGDRTPTLIDTGTMFESLTSQTSNTIWRVTPRTIQFGSRVPYFVYHQEQGHYPNKWRPMLDLPASAAAELNRLVLRHIKRNT